LQKTYIMIILLIIMKFITSLLLKLRPKELPKPTGRWKVENCNIKINKKIDLSNEDHCGPCGQYTKTIIDTQNIINSTITGHK